MIGFVISCKDAVGARFSTARAFDATQEIPRKMPD
jgi:hypothetical protein